MVAVSFWTVIDKKRESYTFKLSRVPTVGEKILIGGCEVEIKEVLHKPLSESNSIAAECYIGG